MRKRKVLRIGVDLDLCVVNLYSGLIRIFKNELKLDFEKIINNGPVSFWLHEWPEVKKSSRAMIFVNEVFKKPFIYQDAVPIPGAVEVLNKWRKQGHRIWLITARPKKTVGKITLQWLKNNNLGWANKRTLFSGYSYKERANFKSKVSKELDLHVFIEDHAEAVRKIDSDSMILKLVLKYPWNMAEKIGKKARFVEDWQEIDKVVQSVSHNLDISLI